MDFDTATFCTCNGKTPDIALPELINSRQVVGLEKLVKMGNDFLLVKMGDVCLIRRQL